MFRKYIPVVLAAAASLSLAVAAVAQDAQTEKMLIANERAINEAIAKGNVAAFKEHVAADAWSIDPAAGRMPVSEFLKSWPQMSKEMKLTSWDILDPKVTWVGADAAVITYKWVGKGTFQGQPIPSPVWSSTVWSKRDSKWVAVFHQESAAAEASPAKK